MVKTGSNYGKQKRRLSHLSASTVTWRLLPSPAQSPGLLPSCFPGSTAGPSGSQENEDQDVPGQKGERRGPPAFLATFMLEPRLLRPPCDPTEAMQRSWLPETLLAVSILAHSTASQTAVLRIPGTADSCSRPTLPPSGRLPPWAKPWTSPSHLGSLVLPEPVPPTPAASRRAGPARKRGGHELCSTPAVLYLQENGNEHQLGSREDPSYSALPKTGELHLGQAQIGSGNA